MDKPITDNPQGRIDDAMKEGGFITIIDLLDTGVDLFALVDAIEAGSVMTVDRFNRRVTPATHGTADRYSIEHCLDLLRLWKDEWEPLIDEELVRFGWEVYALPDFKKVQSGSISHPPSLIDQRIDFLIHKAFPENNVDPMNPQRKEKKLLIEWAVANAPKELRLTKSTAEAAYKAAREAGKITPIK